MKLKVMSFNLRLSTKPDGENAFYNRFPKVIACIRAENPDIIGFQECLPDMKEALREQLSPTYTIIGCGQDAGYQGESSCIAYRNQTTEVVNLHTYMLSATPDQPATRFHGVGQSKYPRQCIYAELHVTGMKENIHFFNTHLDHHSAEARTLGMMFICQQISKISGGKILLVGDLNAKTTNNEIATNLPLHVDNRPMVEASAPVTHTFHNYGAIEGNYKIDYIYTDAMPLDSYTVADNHENGIYISDHYPLIANIEF